MISRSSIDLGAFNSASESGVLTVLLEVDSLLDAGVNWSDLRLLVGAIRKTLRREGAAFDLTEIPYYPDVLADEWIEHAHRILAKEYFGYLPKVQTPELFCALTMSLAEMRRAQEGTSEALLRRVLGVWIRYLDHCGSEHAPAWIFAVKREARIPGGYVRLQISQGLVANWGCRKYWCANCGGFMGYGYSGDQDMTRIEIELQAIHTCSPRGQNRQYYFGIELPFLERRFFPKNSRVLGIGGRASRALQLGA